MLAMLILPVTGALFIVLFAALMGPFLNSGGPPPAWAMLPVWAGVYAFIGLYWVLLWRPVVRWTRRRRLATILSIPITLAAGVAFGLGFQALARGSPGFLAMMVGGGVPPIVWVLATVLIWRETPSERAARLARTGGDGVVCPVCGYNMTGLSESACPECGARYTLEALIAAQPAADGATLAEPAGR